MVSKDLLSESAKKMFEAVTHSNDDDKQQESGKHSSSSGKHSSSHEKKNDEDKHSSLLQHALEYGMGNDKKDDDKKPLNGDSKHSSLLQHALDFGKSDKKDDNKDDGPSSMVMNHIVSGMVDKTPLKDLDDSQKKLVNEAVTHAINHVTK